MKIAVIGKGRVGCALAPAFAAAGHDVAFGVRHPGDPRHDDDSATPVRPIAEATDWADIIVAAIHWHGVEDLLKAMGTGEGKILIDCINPYDFSDNLKPLFEGSASERLQARTRANVVKTLNQVASEVMGTAKNYAIPPLQFVAGDDAGAKKTVMALLEDIGFAPRDVGGLEYAGDLEAMARLYVHLAFTHDIPREASWALIGPEGKPVGH